MATVSFSCFTSAAVDCSLADFTADVQKALHDVKECSRLVYKRPPLVLAGRRLKYKKRDSAIPSDSSNAYSGGLAIILCTAKEAESREICGMNGLSCYNSTLDTIFINYDNWRCVAGPFGDACSNSSGGTAQNAQSWYRKYVIRHEVGHFLGARHPTKAELEGETVAPVMMQQTKGIGKLRANVDYTALDRRLMAL